MLPAAIFLLWDKKKKKKTRAIKESNYGRQMIYLCT